jgi:hypothetical protein
MMPHVEARRSIRTSHFVSVLARFDRSLRCRNTSGVEAESGLFANIAKPTLVTPSRYRRHVSHTWLLQIEALARVATPI